MIGIRRFRSAWLTLLLFLPLQGLALNVYLQPERIFQGDIVKLVLHYESDIPSLYALDTSPLETDFEVIDAQSRIHRLGSPDEPGLRMEWVVHIAPKGTGSFEVPPLRLGEHTSDPLWLNVEPRTDRDRKKYDISLEMEAAPVEPYVGQQVIVVMRLLSNVALDNGRISEPEIGQGKIYRNIEDRHYSMQRDGRHYDMVERRLSFFANQIGALQLGAASFRGNPADNPNRQILRKSTPIALQIEPKPAAFGDQVWLPAGNLEFSQHWEKLDGRLEVGQSLGFTLLIKAKGLAAESLPIDLASQDNTAFRIYPDEAITSNTFEKESIIGKLEQSFVFVASQPGIIDLPPLTLRWWDTGSNSLRESSLPGRQYEVFDPSQFSSSTDFDSNESSSIYNSMWFALFILLIGVVLPLGKQSPGQWIQARLRHIRNIRFCEMQFKSACLHNNPELARIKLIEYARQNWCGEKFYGLQAVADRIADDRFSDQLIQLDAAIYARHSTHWEGRHLWQAFVARQSRVETDSGTPSVLPRLYPTALRRRFYPSP